MLPPLDATSNLCVVCRLQALQSVASAFLATAELPGELRPAIVEHMMLVHQSVRQFSARFAEELRRHNYVTVSAIACWCTLLALGEPGQLFRTACQHTGRSLKV